MIDSLIQNPLQRPCVVRGQRDGGMKREMLGCGRWHRGCWVGSRCKEPSNQTKVSRVIYFEGTKIYGSRLFLKELSQLPWIDIRDSFLSRPGKRIPEFQVKTCFQSSQPFLSRQRWAPRNTHKGLVWRCFEIYLQSCQYMASCRQKQQYWSTGLLGLKHRVNLWSEYLVHHNQKGNPTPIECCGMFCHTRARQSPMFIKILKLFV